MSQYLDALVDRADLDEIIREIDALCAKREWNELAALRNKCAAAVKTGRQVWPAATLANYRLALHADAKTAAESLQHPTSTFSMGPLTEVIAQSTRGMKSRNTLPTRLCVALLHTNAPFVATP